MCMGTFSLSWISQVSTDQPQQGFRAPGPKDGECLLRTPSPVPRRPARATPRGDQAGWGPRPSPGPGHRGGIDGRRGTRGHCSWRTITGPWRGSSMVSQHPGLCWAPSPGLSICGQCGYPRGPHPEVFLCSRWRGADSACIPLEENTIGFPSQVLAGGRGPRFTLKPHSG